MLRHDILFKDKLNVYESLMFSIMTQPTNSPQTSIKYL